jgi:predicted nucleic acid-binding protein
LGVVIDQVVLLDTGPIVALLHKGDAHHAECVTEAKRLKKRHLLTTWPVLTEAAWLLRARPQAVSQLLASVALGTFQLAPLDASVASWIADFFKRYADREPQLADASLVYLADHRATTTVLTLDYTDFSIYRTRAGKAFSLVPAKR